jgi:hypothetical protein
MDKIIAKPVALVALGQLAHLCKIDLIMAPKAVEDMLEVFSVARNV